MPQANLNDLPSSTVSQRLAGRPKNLRSFLTDNLWFFIFAGLLILSATIYLFSKEQGDLVLQLNQHRTPGRDTLFIVVTQLAEPLSYLLVVAVFALYRYRTAFFTIAVGATASIIALSLKETFQHARPLRWFYDNANHLWHALDRFDPLVYNNSWAYSSFPSGHTISAFALFSFIAFNARHNKHFIGLLCLFIATAIAMSRVYLLMHFVKDITAGAILGIFIGATIFFVQFKVSPENKFLNKGFLAKRPNLA